MICETYAYTHKGGRQHNEDCLTYKEKDTKATWVLADGLGGHAGGEIASQIGVEAIVDYLDQIDEVTPISLKEAVDCANSRVISAQEEQPHTKRMKTTLVAALTDYTKLYWANVGDSRLYFFREGQLIAHTVDHTVSYKAYLAEEIAYEEIRNHEDKSKLLRVVGNDDKCKVDLNEEGIVLQEGDAFLLCSDGFWEYIYEIEMAIDLQKAQTSKHWIDAMLQRHMRRAQANHDNYSVIGVFVK